LGGALDLDKEVAVAPQAVGDAGLVLAQPVVVRNADIINLQNRILGLVRLGKVKLN
jgi:hypothetical protein